MFPREEKINDENPLTPEAVLMCGQEGTPPVRAVPPVPPPQRNLLQGSKVT